MNAGKSIPLSAIFAKKGIRPSRRLGQNFMVDRNMIDFLARQASLTGEDVVLEVGAGAGFLTAVLAAQARRVVAVEIDRRLCDIAADRLASLDNVTLVRADALCRGKWAPPVLEAVEAAGRDAGSRLKLVSNLPYCIATAVAEEAMTGQMQFDGCWFTCQKEVADRMTAAPGDADYGYLSVLVSLMASARVLRVLPPTVFWPRPKVDSAIVELKEAPEKPPRRDLERLFEGIGLLFRHRRRQVGAALRVLGFDESDIFDVERLLSLRGLSTKERVFRLSPPAVREIAERMTA